MARRIGLIQGGRVLDVATGRGSFIGVLMRALGGYTSFTGIDVDREALATARGAFEGDPVEFLEMDATAMTFADRTFDTVAMANSMHHLYRVQDALSEMLRVLKEGGHLLICEPFCDGDQSEAQMADTAKHHWSADVDMALGKFHRHTYQRGEVRSLVEELGLRGQDIMETSRPLDCLFCEDAPRCEDPLDEGMVSAAQRDLQEDLERLDRCEDPLLAGRLRTEAAELMTRVGRTGVHPASTLFVVGRA